MLYEGILPFSYIFRRIIPLYGLIYSYLKSNNKSEYYSKTITKQLANYSSGYFIKAEEMNFIFRRIPTILDKLHNNKFISLPIRVSIFFENLFAFINKNDIKFSFNKKLKLFKASENKYIRFYSDKSRFFLFYRDGIKSRGDFIFNSYCLNKIKFKKSDVVIDCGANAGDLFIELSKYINPKNYIAIEPNPIDFKCLNLNCPSSRIFNLALGDKNDILDFFISTSCGDSSIIRPKVFSEIKKVDVLKLDSLIINLEIKKIKLLKVEAEGYEPEVLLGAKDSLKICDYVAVDGGYERGLKEEQTFTEITNYLIKNGFEIFDIYFPWNRALFKNSLLSKN